MYHLKRIWRSYFVVCFYLFDLSIHSLSTVPFQCLYKLQMLATDYSDTSTTKSTHREFLSGTFHNQPNRWQMENSRGSNLSNLNNRLAWQIYEICIFSLLCRTIDYRQCRGPWWHSGETAVSIEQSREHEGEAWGHQRGYSETLSYLISCLCKSQRKPHFLFLPFVNFSYLKEQQ